MAISNNLLLFFYQNHSDVPRFYLMPTTLSPTLTFPGDSFYIQYYVIKMLTRIKNWIIEFLFTQQKSQPHYIPVTLDGKVSLTSTLISQLCQLSPSLVFGYLNKYRYTQGHWFEVAIHHSNLYYFFFLLFLFFRNTIVISLNASPFQKT